MIYITTIDGIDYKIELLEDQKLCLNGQEFDFDFREVDDQGLYSLIVEGRSFEAHVNQVDHLWQVLMQGTLFEAEVVDEREKRLREAASVSLSTTGLYTLNSPMPGLVVSLPVNVGDQVATGDLLVVLESMKMQNELRSPQDGTVTDVLVNEGDNVEQKQAMITISPPTIKRQENTSDAV